MPSKIRAKPQKACLSVIYELTVRSVSCLCKVFRHSGSRVFGITDRDDYASDAFGELFEGLGFFVAKLGPPLNAYAEIFKNAGHFFTDMRNIMNSGAKNTTGNRYADPYHIPAKWQ